jgi:hypothetical protein
MITHRLYQSWTASAKAEHELEEKQRQLRKISNARKSQLPPSSPKMKKKRKSKSKLTDLPKSDDEEEYSKSIVNVSTPQQQTSSSVVVSVSPSLLEEGKVTKQEMEEFDIDEHDLHDLQAFEKHKQQKEKDRQQTHFWVHRRFTFKTAWEEKETKGA